MMKKVNVAALAVLAARAKRQSKEKRHGGWRLWHKACSFFLSLSLLLLHSVHYDEGGHSTEEEEQQEEEKQKQEESLRGFKVMCTDPTDMKQNSAGLI